ncbi:hypothetical protein BHM03_00047878 [Ensete ventricosum]|nr:hypothetical protein BHM03_00047878 [Ensete ventricosum]
MTFHCQVAEPLRAMVVGAPLEEARHLAQRYDRMRQEAEAQATEVSKRHIKVRETVGAGDNISKLEAAEAKLQELKSNMAATGKEAVAAMAAVEAQQQRLTLQRLIAMVLPLSNQSALTIRRSYKSSNNLRQRCMRKLLFLNLGPCLGMSLHLLPLDLIFHLQVSDNGWAEGECKGKAGWFPCAYIEKRERVLASKIASML